MGASARPRILSYPLAAEELGISLSTFRKHVLPDLRPMTISPGRVGVPREQIDELIMKRTGISVETGKPISSWDAALG